MSHNENKHEYDDADWEDQVDEEEVPMPAQVDEQENATIQVQEDDTEVQHHPNRHYEEDEYAKISAQVAEEVAREKFIAENPLEEAETPEEAEETPVPNTPQPVPTEEEMAKAYEEFRALCVLDSREEKAKKVDEWAKSKGLSGMDIPGTLSEQYEEVCNQIRFEVEKIQAERKAVLEADAKARAEKAKAEQKKVEEARRKAPKIERTKTGKAKSGLNAKGKLQGQKKVVVKEQGRQATRKAKAEKNPVQIVAKETVVAQIEIETEEDEEEPVVLVLKEQHLEYETPVAKATPVPKAETKEGNWTTVKTKKPAKVTPRAPAKAVTPAKAVVAVETEVRTRLCVSVTTKSKCPHGDKCRFAHSVSELARKECRYGKECRYVRCVGVDTYKNNSDRVCSYFHCQETMESYLARMGIKMPKVAPAKVAPAPAKVLTTPVKRVAPKLAPWAPAKAVVAPASKVSRWDVKPATKVVVKATVRVPKALFATLSPQLISQGIEVIAV